MSLKGSTNKFMFAITSGRLITVSVGGSTYVNHAVLTLSKWSLLSATFQAGTDFKTLRVTWYIDLLQGLAQSYTITSSISFINTDKIRIGGTNTMIGQVTSVRIFSPGSAEVLSIYNLLVNRLNFL